MKQTIETSEDFELCRRISAAGYSVRGDAALSTVHLGTPQTLTAFYHKQRWHGNGVRQAISREKLCRAFSKTPLLRRVPPTRSDGFPNRQAAGFIELEVERWHVVLHRGGPT